MKFSNIFFYRKQNYNRDILNLLLSSNELELQPLNYVRMVRSKNFDYNFIIKNDEIIELT